MTRSPCVFSRGQVTGSGACHSGSGMGGVFEVSAEPTARVETVATQHLVTRREYGTDGVLQGVRVDGQACESSIRLSRSTDNGGVDKLPFRDHCGAFLPVIGTSRHVGTVLGILLADRAVRGKHAHAWAETDTLVRELYRAFLPIDAVAEWQRTRLLGIALPQQLAELVQG